ncbi:MAG: NERD domain-containing protein [Candidatus Peregrinibacteria bacterium GW2011_GWC2_33_13]|nr:MAG: NERD domain-containing protein [Candidatus Peregrinibacteria bacterium GW2011_GWC2_33_13]
MSIQAQLDEFLSLLLQLLFLLLNPVILIPVTVIIVIFILLYKNKQYKKSAYYQITKNPYLSVKKDLGKYGEYLTYKCLRHFENNGGKFLFNIYIPKENNETTEIDVLLICSKGLFVFESKNYSGWIFGNETQKNWTQIIYDDKYSFYNPIMQNTSHIKHLKNLVGKNVPMRSIIVFSDRCTLKDITIKSDGISVINRYKLKPVVMKICNQIQTDLLTETEIYDIYNKLYIYTQVSYEVKSQHIEKIRKTI